MTDILVTSPFRPFTLPTQFKAVFNGYIYCGTVDAVDPSVSQVQVYLVNESGDKIPVAQPLRTNAGGFLVYNGQPAKFVTNSNHSLLVRDSLGTQLWYAPNMAEIDPAAASFLAIEALRRSYAEAGYNVVGTFQAGFTLVNANDVGIDLATGKAYAWTGDYPLGVYVVPPGSTPVEAAWSDKSTLNAGAGVVRNGRFALRDFISVKDFGAVGDGVTDDTVAFENATAYCNGLVNYVPPNATISGNAVTLDIPAGRYVLKRDVDVSLGVRVVGDGQTQSVLLCDGNGALRLTPLINNGLFFPEIEHIGFKNTGNRATAIYVAGGTQWFSKLKHIKIEGFDHGLRYQGDGAYYSGMAGSALEDILMYDVNIGIGYYGTAAKNAWINETRFDTIRINNALIGISFKYVDGFEAVRFTNCSLNENSKKYAGTQDSNWVNGIRFQNCDVANAVIESTYFEKIDPKRASTQAEIDGIGGMTHIQIFDYAYQKNVDYYYNASIIISVAEGSTQYFTCGRDMTNTGAICVINSTIRSLLVDDCSINLNEQILNWSSSAVPAYNSKIEFRNCHSAQQLLKASQAERAHFDVRMASSGSRCSLIVDINDMYNRDLNNKMVSSNLLERLEYTDSTLTSKRSVKYNRLNTEETGILYFDITNGRVNASGSVTDPIKTAELFDVICYAKMGYICYVSGTGALRFDYANRVDLVNRDINIILASTIDLQVNRQNVHSFVAMYNSRVSITGGRLICYTQDNDQPSATFLRAYDNNCEVRLQNMQIGYNGTLPAQPYMIISANGNCTVKLNLFGTTSLAAAPNYLAIDSAGMHFDYPAGYTYNLTNIKSHFFGA